jgi:hypothetical protein
MLLDQSDAPKSWQPWPFSSMTMGTMYNCTWARLRDALRRGVVIKRPAMSNYGRSIFTGQIHCSGNRVSGAIFGCQESFLDGVRDHYSILNAKNDATGTTCFTSYQNYSAASRKLAYEVVGDLIDEYICMSETTSVDSMLKFSRAECLAKFTLETQMLSILSGCCQSTSQRDFLG